MNHAYLHLAILAGNQALPVVEFLLERCRSHLGVHLSTNSVNLGEVQVVEGGLPLHIAVAMSQHSTVERMLALGDAALIGLNSASAYACHGTRSTDVDLWKATALGIAIGRDDVRMMRMLLDAGAKINALPTCREIRIAFQCGSTECVMELIERDMFRTAGSDDCDMAHLIKNGTPELVRTVLTSGGATCVGAYTMHLACFAHADILEAVLEATHGAQVNAVYQMMTPLITIAYFLESPEEAVQKASLLLKFGARKDLTRIGKTAADYARDVDLRKLIRDA